MTRTVPIDGKAGSLEIVVGKLPEQIEPIVCLPKAAMRWRFAPCGFERGR